MAAFNLYSSTESSCPPALPGIRICNRQNRAETMSIPRFDRARNPYPGPMRGFIGERRLRLMLAKSVASISRLFRIHMRPVSQLDSKASPVLGNGRFHVFHAARIGVVLVQKIEETAGEIDLFRNLAAENGNV